MLIFALFINDQQLTNGNVLFLNRDWQVVSAVGYENCMFVVLRKEGTRGACLKHEMAK